MLQTILGKLLNTQARFSIEENFTYQLRDAKGNLKKMFQANALGRLFLRTFRAIYKNPIEQTKEGSRVKNNFLARLAAYGLRIPYLTGQWTTSMSISNLVTNAGKAGVASRINGSGAEAAFTFIAIGIGTTAAALGDTTLESEITTNGGERAAAAVSRVTTDVNNDTARLVLTFSFTGTFAVTEAGALNAGAAGVLLNRQVFTAVNVIPGDSLQVTINIDVD